MRIAFLAVSTTVFFFIFKDVLTMVGVDQDELLSQGLDLSHRAKELSKANSGIDISQYSFPMKLFTFLFRPLFVDAPGALGIIVSVENLFYLIITFKLLGNARGWKFLATGNFLAKSALFSFLTVSAALAQISGNLGLAMRQKSQVMILLMFIILSFMEDEKMKEWRRQQSLKQRMKRPEPPPQNAQVATATT